MDRPPLFTSLLTGSRIAIPALLLGYAVARWVDGRDGTHEPSLPWDIGHLAFLATFAGFGLMMVALIRAVASLGGLRRGTSQVAGALGVIGVSLFVWVILGDLVPELEQAYALPEPAMAVGPVLFLIGLAVPLGFLAWTRPQQVPTLAPVAVVLAFVLLALSLDLLVPAALLFGYGLWFVPTAYEQTLRHRTQPIETHA